MPASEQQSTQQPPQAIEDQAEIVSGAAQQGIDRVTSRTGEEVAIEATIDLHVTVTGSMALRRRSSRRIVGVIPRR